MSLGMASHHPGLCPFEFKLRAPTRWLSHVPPMMYHGRWLRGACSIPWDPNSSSQQSAYRGKFRLSEAIKGEGMQKIPRSLCLVLNTTSNVLNASVLPCTPRTFNRGYCLSYKYSCLIKHSMHADAPFGPIHKINSQRRSHVSIRPHARLTFKGLQRFIIHAVEKSLLNNAII
jgi:hypothetical protein